ncbi:MAG: hypothetical protein AAFS04_19715 [Cyanobacteria bacterium J06631_9]
MKFTVIYEGPLKPQKKADRDHKHSIHQQFHEQLKKLWQLPPLSDLYDTAVGVQSSALARESGWVKNIGSVHFLPIVSQKSHTVAEVDITWFRNEAPGNLLNSGDIDNRLKAICDALQIPPHGQMPTSPLSATREAPFYCVVEDDALITGLSVKAERLLRPSNNDDVLLIIEVTTKIIRATYGNLALA